MPSLIQRRLSKAGLSKQTAKGSAAAAATFAYGVDGGSIFKVNLEEAEIPLTWSNRDILGFDRSGAKPGQSLGTVATPNLIGLLLLGVLGSDVTSAPTLPWTVTITNGTVANPMVITTSAAHNLVSGQYVYLTGLNGGGTGANNLSWQVTVLSATTFSIPFNNSGALVSAGTVTVTTQHTITPAATVPYMTAWGSFGTADFANLVDSKVSSLELSWEQAGKVGVKHEIMSITPAFLASQYTETNLELISALGYYTAGGGGVSIEGNAFNLAGGSIKFDTHIVQPVVAATVLPADVVEGKLEVSYSLKLLPTDTGLFREVVFGANTAGALSGVVAFPRLGDIKVTLPGPFQAGATVAGATPYSLTIESTKAKFAVEFPESSPEGGPAELTIAGVATLPASGPSVTATLINGIGAY
jgi:hypothetical protein